MIDFLIFGLMLLTDITRMFMYLCLVRGSTDATILGCFLRRFKANQSWDYFRLEATFDLARIKLGFYCFCWRNLWDFLRS